MRCLYSAGFAAFCLLATANASSSFYSEDLQDFEEFEKSPESLKDLFAGPTTTTTSTTTIPPINEHPDKGVTLPTKRPILIGLLRLDELFSFLNKLQQNFFNAIFPENWGVPKFVCHANPELEKVSRWVNDLSSGSLGGESLASVVREISEGNSSIVRNSAAMPPLLHQIVNGATHPIEKFGDLSDSMLRSIPNLDSLNINTIGNAFNNPNEVEWPVPREALSLLIPVLVTDAAEMRAYGEVNIIGSIMANIENIKVPIVMEDGSLVFSSLSGLFQNLKLPAKLSVTPLALFRNRVIDNISTLWNIIKAPILTKMTVLREDSPAMFGPVLNMASVARVALAVSGEDADQKPYENNQLGQLIGNIARNLRENLTLFFDIFFKSPRMRSGEEPLVARSTQEFLDEPLEDFMNMRFLNFNLPVVGIAEQMAPILYSPLSTLTRCAGGSDCALSTPFPLFPDFLVSPNKVIENLYRRVGLLSSELEKVMVQLQDKLVTSLEKGKFLVSDGTMITEVLNSVLNLSGALNQSIYFVKEKVMKLSHMLRRLLQSLNFNNTTTKPLGSTTTTTTTSATGTTATTATTVPPTTTTTVPTTISSRAFRSILNNLPLSSQELLDVPRNVYSALRTPNRRLQELSSLIPSGASLEELISLKGVTDTLKHLELSTQMLNISPAQNLDELSQISRSLSPNVLRLPLGNIFKDSPLVPESWANLEVGALMDLTKSLDTLFTHELFNIAKTVTQTQSNYSVNTPNNSHTLLSNALIEYENSDAHTHTLTNINDAANNLKNGAQFY